MYAIVYVYNAIRAMYMFTDILYVYMHLYFLYTGSSEPVKYEKQRELEHLVAFVNQQAGTARDGQGNLLPTAGMYV